MGLPAVVREICFFSTDITAAQKKIRGKVSVFLPAL
jgi:hypothetical protein